MDPGHPALLQQRGSNPQPRPSEGRALSIELCHKKSLVLFPRSRALGRAHIEDTTHTTLIARTCNIGNRPVVHSQVSDSVSTPATIQ